MLVRGVLPAGGLENVPVSKLQGFRLPAGFRVGDVVRSLVTFDSGGGHVLYDGDLGVVVGPSTETSTVVSRMCCDFAGMNGVNLSPSHVCRVCLPGGLQVDDVVRCRANLPKWGILVGDLGIVCGPARTDSTSNVECCFEGGAHVEVAASQLESVMLPGGLRVGDAVMSLADIRSPADIRSLQKGDVGIVLGPRSNLTLCCSFGAMPVVNLKLHELTEALLPGGFKLHDVVTSYSPLGRGYLGSQDVLWPGWYRTRWSRSEFHFVPKCRCARGRCACKVRRPGSRGLCGSMRR